MQFWLPIWKRKNRLKGGFTLIEILLAMTIFSFVALAVSGIFISGMKIWKRAGNINFSENELLLNLEIISKELRQSVDVPLIGFAGTSQDFSFAYLKGGSIVKITYKFDSQEKVILRREVNLKDIILDKEDTNYTEKKIMSLEELSLSYFYFDKEENDYVWKDAFTKDKGKFSAISLRGKIKDEEFSKTVFIPIS